jgi:hypothetical protein
MAQCKFGSYGYVGPVRTPRRARLLLPVNC